MISCLNLAVCPLSNIFNQQFKSSKGVIMFMTALSNKIPRTYRVGAYSKYTETMKQKFCCYKLVLLFANLILKR